MGMAMSEFRFSSHLDELEWRTQLHREVGRRWASPACVKTAWEPDPEQNSGILTILSQNAIALIYAQKVSIAFGGKYIPSSKSASLWSLPEWTITPWVNLSWRTKAKIWFGSDKI